MKIHTHLLLLACSALALCAAPRAQAQESESYTNSFDGGTSTASWIYWYGLGYNNTPVTYDPAKDAATNGASGSLRIELPFGASGDQAVFFGTFGNGYGYDGTVLKDVSQLAYISVDVLVSPTNALSEAGNFGTLQIGLVHEGWANGGTFYGSGQIIPAAASNGWVRLTQQVDPADAGNVAGIDFKYTSYSGYPRSPVTFWLDNIQVVTVPASNPPPRMNITRATSGLNLIASASGEQYQRQGIRTVADSYSWVRAAGPVTYSMTIAEMPRAAGFQTHIFLVPGLPGTQASVDYSEPSVIFLDVQSNGNGGANATFRYKVNEPNGNSQIYGPGALASITTPVANGTYSLTFNQGSNVTLAAPGNVSTNFTMPTGDLAVFDDFLRVYFGSQPNQPGNIGLRSVLSRVQVTGAGSPDIDDSFPSFNLNSRWEVIANNPQGVIVLPPGTRYSVNWTLPDAGYILQASSAPTGAPWVDLNQASVQFSGQKHTGVPDLVLPSTDKAFFRLRKP